MTGSLQHLVSSRSWEWLRALCGPMSVDVQLLDLAYAPVPMFPARPGAVGGLLDSDALRRLRPAAEAAVELQSPQVARLASHVVTLAALRVGGATAGVMLVAHPDGGAAEPEHGHVAAISGWLRFAVEQHLASQAVGADHLASLNQALRAAAFDGSDRKLLAMFAEALAVWHDIEVVAYVETASGVFTQAVALAGRARDLPPLVFPPQAVPPPQRLTRMPQTHVDGGDRAGAADALVVTLTRVAGATWLLTLSGEIDACDPALLSGYVSALDLTLALAGRAASARVGLAVASDLATFSHDPSQALHRALERTRRVLGAAAVRFSVEKGGTRPALAGQAGLAGAAPQPAAALLVERHTPVLGRVVFEIERQAAGPWTPVEHAQAHAVADVLERWAERRHLGEGASSGDVFAQSVDDCVSRVLDRGDAVTLAVFECSPAPTARQGDRLITESRRFLRIGDEAGLLPQGRLAFLLAQTPAPQAAAVTRRLRDELSRAAAAAGITIVSEAFATRMPGQTGGSLLHEARPRGDESGPART